MFKDFVVRVLYGAAAGMIALLFIGAMNWASILAFGIVAIIYVAAYLRERLKSKQQ